LTPSITRQAAFNGIERPIYCFLDAGLSQSSRTAGSAGDIDRTGSTSRSLPEGA
jgi:hypothetical protein